VGITRADFDVIEESYEDQGEQFHDTDDFKFKTWVFLDCE
jgi:hypothetical protein